MSIHSLSSSASYLSAGSSRSTDASQIMGQNRNIVRERAMQNHANGEMHAVINNREEIINIANEPRYNAPINNLYDAMSSNTFAELVNSNTFAELAELGVQNLPDNERNALREAFMANVTAARFND